MEVQATIDLYMTTIIKIAVTRILTIQVVREEKFKFDEVLRSCKAKLADAEQMKGERYH